ncbi:unnamed protein product [Rhodiola kirilowii]
MLRFKLALLYMYTVLLVIGSYERYVLGESDPNPVKKTYIVHTDRSTRPDSSVNDPVEWYDTCLKTVSESGASEMLYTYNEVMTGFSARMTENEAELLKNQPGILSVEAEMVYELQTTRTPQFLGLVGGGGSAGFSEPDQVSNLVIAVFDTGIWPESQSFDDTGFGPVPSSWKGQCEVGNNFNASSCNKKLVGARYFLRGYIAAAGPINETLESRSPRDDNGHGTHTASTAAGSPVTGASLFGYAPGTARGMATKARIASYKICWLKGCFGSDILSAIDTAVADGANVMSLSIGGGSPDYPRDNVAIGAFAATQRGIIVSCSAGNRGPTPSTLSNVAPWMISVAASTLDRDFPSYVTLGNGEKYTGVSFFSGAALSPTTLVPIVYGGSVRNGSFGDLCIPGSLNAALVKGKIVVCDRGLNSRVEKGQVVKDAGGVGMIITNTAVIGGEVAAEAHFLPSAAVGQVTGDLIKKYILNSSNPTATIVSGGTKLGVQPSPVVAAFSSRGPNAISPKILKPDLTAPGVNILAAWTGSTGPSGLSTDPRRVTYSILSGTSMSCPHVTGIAALIKGSHPDWSPAAVRSALMTTAYSTYKNGQIIEDTATKSSSTPFDIGAGHINPIPALNPGLVYNNTIQDYVDFLCASSYTAAQIKAITRSDFTCQSGKTYRAEDLNYPSFAVPFPASTSSNATTTVTYARTLTNVGNAGTYTASVSSQTSSAKIVISPSSLSFSSYNEEKTYTVTFTGSSQASGTISSGQITWSDGTHTVSSPVAFNWS